MNAISRRNFLAGAGCMGAAGLLGGRPARADASTSPKKVLLLMCAGGWDISYSLDPKPGVANVDSPEGDMQMFDDIPILVHDSRPGIGAFFEAFSGISAVVNGIAVNSIAHDQCRARMLTGNSSATTPDLCAIVGHQLGQHVAAPNLALGQYAFAGELGVSTTRVGATNQINALIDPANGYPPQPGSPFEHSGFLPDGSEEALIRQWVEGRAATLQKDRAARGFNADRVRDFLDSLGKGDELRQHAGQFGVLGQRMNLSQQAALAVTALRDELAWAVGLGVDGFDTHDDNDKQGPMQDGVFSGLRQIGEALASLPGSNAGNSLLDETIVVAMSEMSRTPRLNADGGKDHHPVTSALVFGGGVVGGRTYGATNDQVESLLVDFESGELDEEGGATLTPGALLAGLCQLAGADASDYVTNTAAFTGLCP